MKLPLASVLFSTFTFVSELVRVTVDEGTLARCASSTCPLTLAFWARQEAERPRMAGHAYSEMISIHNSLHVVLG